MIDHEAVLLACRARLDTLSVVTSTGTFAATSTGYSRSSGSFLTDGFRAGQEVVGTDFTNVDNNTRKTITNVTATAITAAGTTTEAAGTRTLSVGAPANIASENIEFVPLQTEPYFAEEYVPGPMTRETLGTGSDLEVRPLYIVRVHVPQNIGVAGAWSYASALISHFKPGTALTVTDHTVTVRGDAAPFAGQVRLIDSFAVATVTIPLRVRTLNV